MTRKRLIFPIIVLLIFGLVVAGLGKWEWLIWGIVLLCPLMHLFGHNHSGHSNSDSKSNGSGSCH